MKTLVIFDNNGTIYYQATGDVAEPAGGVNFLWVELPDNSYLESIDMSSGEPVPVFKEFEPTPEDSLQAQIDEMNDVLLELILQQNGGEV